MASAGSGRGDPWDVHSTGPAPPATLGHPGVSGECTSERSCRPRIRLWRPGSGATTRIPPSGRQPQRRTDLPSPLVHGMEAEVVLGDDDDGPSPVLEPLAPAAIVLAPARALVELASVVLHREAVPRVGDVEPVDLATVELDDPLQLRDGESSHQDLEPGPGLTG